jgi:hypothetical protein
MVLRLKSTMTLIVWLTVIATSAAQSTDDALRLVTDQAAGFVVIGHLSEANKKFESLADRFGASVPSLFGKIKAELGTTEGLNARGSALLVSLATEGTGPGPVLVYLPVADFDAFLRGCRAQPAGDLSEVELPQGRKAVVGRRGAFAVLAEAPHRAVLAKILTAPLAEVVPQRVYKWASENDAVAVLTSTGLKPIANAARMFAATLQFQFNFGAGPSELRDLLSVVSEFLKGIDTDIMALAVGARFDLDGNLRARTAALFVPDSGVARSAATVRSPRGGPFGDMPSLPYTLACGGVISDRAMQGLGGVTSQMLDALAKKDPARAKRLRQLSDEIKGVETAAMLIGAAPDPAAMTKGNYLVLRVADSKAYLQTYQEFAAAFRETFEKYEFPAGSNVPYHGVRFQRTVLEGLAALEVEWALKNLDQLPAQQQQPLQRYYGPERKVVSTTVAVDDHTLLVRYTEPDGVEPFLAKYRKGARLTGDDQVAKALSLLSEGSQWAAVVNLSECLDVVRKGIVGGFAQQMPPFRVVPPVGLGARLSAAEMELIVGVHAETLTALGDYARQLRQLQPPQNR